MAADREAEIYKGERRLKRLQGNGRGVREQVSREPLGEKGLDLERARRADFSHEASPRLPPRAGMWPQSRRR